MLIKKFKPLEFSRDNLNIQELNKKTGVNWIYASSGKAALYHCLQSLNIKGKVLVPVYICSSILQPIGKLGLSYTCYDINKDDLNADIIDLEKKIIDYQISCVLVASMYGNPANMLEIELLCQKYNIPLIDDAAQSFGLKCNDKYIGTFGNAGFFSFSPGKATPGHLGAFFWTKNRDYSIKRTNHYFLHKLAYYDFYFNRLRIYEYDIFKILTYVKYVLFNLINLHNDKINEFEKPILGGILLANEKQVFRSKILMSMQEELIQTPSLKIITTGAVNSNNHKFVLVCETIELAKLLIVSLNDSNIYVSNGYKLLMEGYRCSTAKSLKFKILEIPLEDDIKKSEYVVEQLNKIIKIYESS